MGRHTKHEDLTGKMVRFGPMEDEPRLSGVTGIVQGVWLNIDDSQPIGWVVKLYPSDPLGFGSPEAWVHAEDFEVLT